MKKLIYTLSLLAAALTTNESFAKYDKAYFNRVNGDRMVSSDIVEWRNIGPAMSGYNETFVCHPTNPDVMFIGPDMRVTYGTWDGGESWQTVKDCDGTGLDMSWVKDFEFSLQNPDYGAAISWLGKTRSCEVYETRDCGRSWKMVSQLKGMHREIAINPSNDKVWYVGAGNFWDIKQNHRSENNIHGTKSPIAAYGHVMRSRDGGKSWDKVATDISPDLDVAKIIFNPNNAKQVIMASNYGVYRSNDDGDSWTKSAVGLPNNLSRDMTSYYDKKSKQLTLFLIEQTTYHPDGKSIKSTGGVFKSCDFGKSWVDISGDLGLDMTRIHDNSNMQDYQVDMAYWLSIPLGQFRKDYPEKPKNIMPAWNRIVVDPTNADVIYVAHNKRQDKSFGLGDVWKSVDGGKRWSPVARSGVYWYSKKDAEYWRERGVESSMNMTFAHVHQEMTYQPEMSFGCRHLAINPRGDLFIGVGQQTLRSNNGGDSWMQIDDIELKPGSNQWIGRGGSNLPGRLIQFNTGVKGQMLFCSGEHGLFKNVDLGDYPDKDAVAFEQIEGQIRPKAAHSIATVAVHPQNPDIIYTLQWRQEHRGEVRRTLDGGKSWENIARVFDCKSAGHLGLAPQASLMFDYKNPDNMYFCAIRTATQEVGSSINSSKLTMGEYGVYRSTDAGFTWSTANNGLPEKCSVRRLTMDPKNPQIIYASLNQRTTKNVEGGLYISTNGAKSWRKVKTPIGVTSINDTFINKSNGEIYISCGTSDGNSNCGGVWRSSNNCKSWDKIFHAPIIWHTEVSEANQDIIMVTLPGNNSNNKTFMNSGVYISFDNATSWSKINKGLGQPNAIVEIKPDPIDERIIWCSSWGCGWYKGIIKK